MEKSRKDTMIKLVDVGMQWATNEALSHVDLDINRGDFLAITGPNGGGKTTLLRIILKLLKPSSGRVLYLEDGREVKELPIGYLPQKNLIDSRFPLTVSEVVAQGIAHSRLNSTERRLRLEDTLDKTGLCEISDRPIGKVSGGQLQRALLGRAIISRPSLLVLDEPLSYLDKHFEQRMYDLVRHLARTTTILLVSHEMSTIAAMANRHLIVDGSIHECHSASHLVHYDCRE